MGVVSRERNPYIRKGIGTVSVAEELLKEVGTKPAEGLVKSLKQMDNFKRGEGERGEFETIVRELREWKGGHVIGMLKFARWSRARGELEGAMKAVNEVLDVEGGLVEAWVLKARVYEELGDRKMAAKIVAVVERMVGGQEREEMRKWAKKLKRGRWLLWGK